MFERLRQRLTRRGYREQVRCAATEPEVLVAGEPEDRLASLDGVLAECAGKTVLDIGCHVGTVAEAFAGAGVRHIDGCDMSKPALEICRARVTAILPESRFFWCDLSAGPAALQPLELSASYDIVCYLGMHHHLANQMSKRRLRALVHDIAGRTRELLLVRTDGKMLAMLEEMLLLAGLVKTYGPDRSNLSVGPLTIFRKAEPKRQQSTGL